MPPVRTTASRHPRAPLVDAFLSIELLQLGVAAIGLVMSTGGIALLPGFVRSERLARRLGGIAESLIGRAATRFGRTPPAGLPERVESLRATGQTLISTKGLLGLGTTLVPQAGYAVMLTPMIRCWTSPRPMPHGSSQRRRPTMSRPAPGRLPPRGPGRTGAERAHPGHPAVAIEIVAILGVATVGWMLISAFRRSRRRRQRATVPSGSTGRMSMYLPSRRGHLPLGRL